MQNCADDLLESGLNIMSLVLIFLLVPETKRYTLEEIDYIFAIPTKKFIRYHCNIWLPWFIRHYVLWSKDAKLIPLYKFGKGVSEAGVSKV